MAEETTPSPKPVARPTGKRQLTGVSTTNSADYQNSRRIATVDDEKLGGGPARFLPEVAEEMKKVIWPTAKQMVNYTLIVFAFLIIVTGIVWGVDVVVAKGVDGILTP